MPIPPTTQEIRDIAREAIDIFNSYNLDSCLFGSAGCSLYGLSRVPNDVDLIVMTHDYDSEELKNILTADDNSYFYTRASATPGADYRVLYYRISRRRSCKVDILVPGILDIPHLDSSAIEVIDGLPVLPLLALLLLKVRGWKDHRASHRSDMRQKQYVDVRDINQMLGVAKRRNEHVEDAWWMSDEFCEIGCEWVSEYVDCHGRHRSWEYLGFDLE